MDMALESSIFNAPRLVSGTKSSYLVPYNRQMRMPMKILEKSNRYPSQLVLNCKGPRGFRSYFGARCRVNDSSFAGRAGLNFVGEDSESSSDENAVYCVNLDFVRELVKRGIVLAAIVCGVLVFGCKRVFAMEGVVNVGHGVIERSMLMLRNAWPKTLQVLQVFKEQGLILAALLGLSAFFSMAETSITTLWPWKVRELAEKEPENGVFRKLHSDVTRFLTTILIGTTVVNIGQQSRRRRYSSMTTPYTPFRVINCNIERRPSLSRNFHHLNTSLSSAFKTILRELRQVPMQIDASGTIKNASVKILDAFVDSVFEFADQPLLPSQSNFAPVDELKEAVLITEIEGNIPDNFQEGVYIRNGPNPLFGRLKITKSIFGRSSHMWVEGEGMLHALYFTKASDGSWNVVYNNRHVETETFKLEKQRNKPSFLPAAEGDSPAVLSAFLLNSLRFGKVNKEMSNTNIFKHSGKLYSIAETDIPQEIDIFTLKTCNNWDVNGSWKRPFSSHPKRVPDTGELVIMGVDPIKPFFEVGVVSADGKKLIHKVDLKLKRCTLSHEIGVTQRYNVIMDFPLIIDIKRLISGGPLIKYNGEEYARIGIMPRYGDSDSIKWFEVEPSCCFHIFNSFEDDGEVVVWGCRALDSIVPGPDMGVDKFEWFSRRFRPLNSDEKNMNTSTEDGLLFSRCYEWRLNMQTGEVRERNLIGTKFSMDFPIINEHFTGVQNRFGYTQVVDSIASSTSGLAKYGGLAKLYFEEADTRFTLIKRHCEEPIKVEYHMFEANTFCTGSAFVPKHGGVEEDDGWIITFVHNEDSNTSQVYVIDTKKFSCEPVAKITLPCRVPYGFHGAFMPISLPT